METKIVTIADGINGGVYSIANERGWDYLMAKFKAHCLEHAHTKNRFLSYASLPAHGGIFTIVAGPVEYISFPSGGGGADDDMSQVTSPNEWHNHVQDDHRSSSSSWWSKKEGEEGRQTGTTTTTITKRRGKILQCIELPADFYKNRPDRKDAWKAHLGNDNLDVAEVCSQLAQDYMVHGNNIEAMKMYRKSLSIRQTFLGKNHPTISKTYSNIGTVYWMQGEHDEARRMHQLALTTRLEAIEERYSSATSDKSSTSSIWGNQVRYADGGETMKPCFYSALLSNGLDAPTSHRDESATTHTADTQASDKSSRYSRAQVSSTSALRTKSTFEHHVSSYLIQQ
ncbi:unnamed protein product [Cylindrotheca closterium]|uniref:Kinesin light chain n=1 Tax=Cylindrotheca closterium TaxID=2856 RepID=A0AAD2CYX0_9STRA|nr:unnamed protein product [Cylindrotheca closterium]